MEETAGLKFQIYPRQKELKFVPRMLIQNIYMQFKKPTTVLEESIDLKMA